MPINIEKVTVDMQVFGAAELNDGEITAVVAGSTCAVTVEVSGQSAVWVGEIFSEGNPPGVAMGTDDGPTKKKWGSYAQLAPDQILRVTNFGGWPLSQSQVVLNIEQATGIPKFGLKITTPGNSNATMHLMATGDFKSGVKLRRRQQLIGKLIPVMADNSHDFDNTRPVLIGKGVMSTDYDEWKIDFMGLANGWYLLLLQFFGNEKFRKKHWFQQMM